jgi:hypothetical protein
MIYIIKTEEEFFNLLKDSKKKIIYFKTNTCIFCTKLSLIINENLNNFSNVIDNFFEVNLSDLSLEDFILEKKLKGVPILMIYENGNEIIEKRHIGFLPQQEFIDLLKNF